MANKKTSKKVTKKSSKKIGKIKDQTIHSVTELLEETPILSATTTRVMETPVHEPYDNAPDDSAECYLGVYYKVLTWAQQYTKVAIWNKRTNNWVEFNVQTHPQANEDQKKDAIRRIITDVCAHPSTREKDSRYYLA